MIKVLAFQKCTKLRNRRSQVIGYPPVAGLSHFECPSVHFTISSELFSCVPCVPIRCLSPSLPSRSLPCLWNKTLMVHLQKFLFVRFNLIRFTFAKNRGQRLAFLRIGVRRDGGSSAVELKTGCMFVRVSWTVGCRCFAFPSLRSHSFGLLSQIWDEKVLAKWRSLSDDKSYKGLFNT